MALPSAPEPSQVKASRTSTSVIHFLIGTLPFIHLARGSLLSFSVAAAFRSGHGAGLGLGKSPWISGGGDDEVVAGEFARQNGTS